MQIIRTVERAIDELGGDTAVAQQLGIGQSAVGNWKLRGHFPPRTYVFINRELGKRGLAIDLSLFPDMFD